MFRFLKRDRTKKMKNKDLAWLLNLANDMRAAKNDKLLDDIPDSVPKIPQMCVIANAFNYGCEVYPNSSAVSQGTIKFRTREDAETYCEVTGVDSEYIREDPITYGGKLKLTAPLTRELNQLALEFDRRKGPAADYIRYTS